MTVYEAAEYLEQAIESVLEQTFEDFELLILDDGSRDFRVFAACEKALSDPRVQVFEFHPDAETRGETVRYATLINYGAEHTTGEYLTFLCSDDFYLPDRLERMVATLSDGPDDCPQYFDVVYGAQRLLYSDGSEGLRATAGFLGDAYHRVDLNSVMVTRRAFEEVGGFPDTPPTPQLWRQADAHLWRRLTDAGHIFVPVPGGPTDCKRFRPNGIDERVKRGETPWLEVAE